MEGEQLRREPWWVWWSGVALGIGTHVAFAATVWWLFRFLHDRVRPPHDHWLLVDSLLALQFAVVHSLLLYPTTKRWLTRFIKPEWYGLFFCLATCAGLALVFAGWRGSSTVVWAFSGGVGKLVRACFYASWGLLFYSLALSGLGYQTGFTPWWYWLRRRPQPRRSFVTGSLYRFLRHPIYLSFLGLIWFTPRLSTDHALLTGLWTIYIFVGSYLKDERLAWYAGAAYREYQSTVPGYPFAPGPLGRRSTAPGVGADGKRWSPAATLRRAA